MRKTKDERMIRGFGGDRPTITTTETQRKANLSARSRAVTVARQLCPSSGGSDASSRSPRMANWRALVHASTPRLLRPRGRLPGIHRIDSDPKFFFFVRKGITSRGLDGRWVQKRLLPTVERAFWTDPVFINRPRLALSLSDAAANNQSCSAAAGGVTYATFFIF
jgi:hypothetical protein